MGREWSGGHLGGQDIVGHPSRMAGSVQKALPEGQEWSGSPPGG